MKKITFALAACVVFAFAACGGNATETANTDSTNHDSTPVEAPAADTTSVKDSAATVAAPVTPVKKEEVKTKK